MKSYLFILSLTVCAGSIGCYYDSEQALYPPVDTGTPVCDTAAFTYSTMIEPIIASNCNMCHSIASAPASGGNIVTEGYANLQALASNGRLYGAINHSPGYSAMPKNANKLSSCDITYIKRWIDSGTPNN
jgi:hypothetical protein